jgi:hypothetical protein
MFRSMLSLEPLTVGRKYRDLFQTGGRIDAWSARVTFDSTPNVTAQISTGHLHPEELEPRNIQRTTASVAYSTAAWNTSLIVDRNDRSEGRTTNAFVAESGFKFGGVNYLTGRSEIVDKYELIADETGVWQSAIAVYLRSMEG